MATQETALSQALAAVEFVIDRHGETKGVFLPLSAWEVMVEALEDAEDVAVAREYLLRRAGTSSIKEMDLRRPPYDYEDLRELIAGLQRTT